MPLDQDHKRPERGRSRALSRTPHRARTRRPWGVAVWLCAGLSVLAFLTLAVRNHPQGVAYDRLFVSVAAHHQFSVLRRIAVAVSNAASLPALSIGVVLFAGVFVLERRGLAPGLAMGIAVWGTYLLYRLEKLGVHRPRPWLFDVGATPAGSAFPSGHEAQAVAFYGMLAILVGWGRSPRVKCLLGGAAAGVALLIGIARMYLGAHWLTDILAGAVLGMSVVSAILLFGMADAGLEPEREPGPDLIRASWLRRLMRGDAAARRPPEEHDIEIPLPEPRTGNGEHDIEIPLAHPRVGNGEHETLAELGAYLRSPSASAPADPVVYMTAAAAERPAKTGVDIGDRAIDEAKEDDSATEAVELPSTVRAPTGSVWQTSRGQHAQTEPNRLEAFLPWRLRLLDRRIPKTPRRRLGGIDSSVVPTTRPEPSPDGVQSSPPVARQVHRGRAMERANSRGAKM
jgi:membrane-associated phospholipid phosphatase